jgi:hypothetical protein
MKNTLVFTLFMTLVSGCKSDNLPNRTFEVGVVVEVGQCSSEMCAAKVKLKNGKEVVWSTCPTMVGMELYKLCSSRSMCYTAQSTYPPNSYRELIRK